MPPDSNTEKTALVQRSSDSLYSQEGVDSRRRVLKRLILSLICCLVLVVGAIYSYYATVSEPIFPKGPYQLFEQHVGHSFFDYYEFYDGPDSVGSAGFNIYVSRSRAEELGILDSTKTSAIMSSADGGKPLRESLRLESKTRFNRGLFILDVAHTPSGCGLWPAFWLTDRQHWPEHGEIDVLESMNGQTVAKTALHTSEGCSMYAHIPPNETLYGPLWDRATGIPDTFTGELDTETNVPADNCWTLTPHQWANQGCVAMHKYNDTMGHPMNVAGGGLYVLEWDEHYMKSWVFRRDEIPENLEAALDGETTMEPKSWPLPYAYFAIGEGSGCPNDHFQNMQVVINLAFCGNVAGNRFASDCPNTAAQYSDLKDPIQQCNAFLKSNPKVLENAFWEINGVYIYQRTNKR